MKSFLCDCNQARLFFLVIFTSLLSLNSFAQEAQKTKQANPNIPYDFKSERSTYTNLDGGTIVSALSADNAVTNKLPLGFSFQLGCQTYSDFYASSNGTLSFDAPFPNSSNSDTALTPANLVLLAPLWDDLSGTAGTFSYNTAGAAPNRVFTAEWKNWKWLNTISSATISFQVKLYEGSNIIEYLYKQEQTPNSNNATASIGMFNGKAINAPAKQLWLDTSDDNPIASINFINTINTRPATGQVYRFIRKDNKDSCELIYYGQTVINEKGGTNATDGLRIVLSGAANMQVKKENTNQIMLRGGELVYGTSRPYYTQDGNQGIVLSVDGNFGGGTLGSPKEMLTIISNTQQSLIESSPGHFVNEIKLSSSRYGKTYYLTIKYTYKFPENYFLIDYTVTIPTGNTYPVRLAHGWDTVLKDFNTGPGFVIGTAPNLIVGAKRESSFFSNSYVAFEYIGGVKWSGYYSASFYDMSIDLGSTTTFKNTISDNPDTDNAIGISIDFGSSPGTFTSSNKLVFGCEAGDVAPTLAPNGRICQNSDLDLNSLITSPTPIGLVVVWKKNGVVVTNPTAVTAAGTYTANYFSAKYNCSSPARSTNIVLDNTCCYKPAVNTGKEAGSLTIISTLDRKNNPDVAPRNGILILESKEKGFAISRVLSPETTIASPVEGMLVYDTKSNCLKLYNGTTWNCIQQTCVDNK